MSTLTFSISVPIYKQAEYLPTALKSLRCQEVNMQVAALDATPDNSVQQVLQHYRNMIHYSYHRADEGQSAAIAEGWANTNGDIVTWLNADDYYFPDTLKKVSAIFEKYPEVDVVYGHSVYVTADNSFQMYFPVISSDVSQLPYGCIICQPSCFVRRQAIERIGGINAALHYTMDWDLWLRLYQAGCKFYFLEELLSAVIVHPATKTASASPKRYEEIDNLLKPHASWWQRKQTLAGFRYHDVLTAQETKASRSARWAYPVLNMLNHVRRRLSNMQRPSIHGLQCRTNVVIGNHCNILLPWYRAEPAKIVDIIVNKPMEYFISFADQQIALQYQDNQRKVFLGEHVDGYRYQARLPSNASNVLSLKIQSNQPGWRVLGVEFQ